MNETADHCSQGQTLIFTGITKPPRFIATCLAFCVEDEVVDSTTVSRNKEECQTSVHFCEWNQLQRSVLDRRPDTHIHTHTHTHTHSHTHTHTHTLESLIYIITGALKISWIIDNPTDSRKRARLDPTMGGDLAGRSVLKAQIQLILNGSWVNPAKLSFQLLSKKLHEQSKIKPMFEFKYFFMIIILLYY